MSRAQIYLHFVFVTKRRVCVITPDRERELFAYIVGISSNLKVTVIRVNAALNHVHLLVKFPTTLTVAEYMAKVKRMTSIYLKQEMALPHFEGWAREYFVETVTYEGVSMVKKYIMEQKEHHKIETFEEEWTRRLAQTDAIEWDMRFFDR